MRINRLLSRAKSFLIELTVFVQVLERRLENPLGIDIGQGLGLPVRPWECTQIIQEKSRHTISGDIASTLKIKSIF